ncbi:MAG: helix-turn-helix domain-containing protein, partial [Ramlibacter sp.]|nr:helix-turn-helix domain-containing protein [Ramlibacter sp.]
PTHRTHSARQCAGCLARQLAAQITVPSRPLSNDIPPTPAPGRSHAGAPGAVAGVSTDGINARERMDFWHHAHLGRMALSRPDGEPRPFEGRVRRIMGEHAHVVEHEAGALTAVRTAAQCRRDGVDYVSVNYMLDSTGSHMDHGGQVRLAPGTMYFVDSAQPVEFRQSSAHSVSIFLPRSKVQDAVGDPRLIPVVLQAHTGIGAVLQSHMRMIITQAEHMTPGQRVVVISACVDMALAALQTARDGAADAGRFADGFYQAARTLIERDCPDPQLDPGAVAAALGCSRATLYRLFAREGQSVAALIWHARLQRARALIASGRWTHRPLADIAFMAGFTDQAGFNRMFKRHYGMTPGEARARDAATRVSGDLGMG